MNTFLPYLNYKIAVRLLIVLPLFILSKELLNINGGFLLSSLFFLIRVFLNLYIWGSFWKLIVHQLGEKKMTPFFIVLVFAIILLFSPLMIPLVRPQGIIQFKVLILAITQIVFALKLFTISHDLFNLKKRFIYSKLLVGLLLLLGIGMFDSDKEYSELFSALSIYIFVIIWIANYIFQIQILNRAEKARISNGENPIEKLIKKIGEER